MKYIVEAGAFVTKRHQKRLTVYANSPEEAAEKAKDKFFKIESKAAWSDLCTVTIDSVRQVPPADVHSTGKERGNDASKPKSSD
jgi:hypothetical protein